MPSSPLLDLPNFSKQPLDEADEIREGSDVLKIVASSELAFTYYRALLWLQVWTRPDLADQVSIRPYWFTREGVIKYSSGELSAHDLLTLGKNESS